MNPNVAVGRGPYDREALLRYLQQAVLTRRRCTFKCPSVSEANRLRWAFYRARNKAGLRGVGISLGGDEVHLVPYIEPQEKEQLA